MNWLIKVCRNIGIERRRWNLAMRHVAAAILSAVELGVLPAGKTVRKFSLTRSKPR